MKRVKRSLLLITMAAVLGMGFNAYAISCYYEFGPTPDKVWRCCPAPGPAGGYQCELVEPFEP